MRIDTNILPSDAFLAGLSLEHVSTVKRACLIAYSLARRITLKEWQLGGTLDVLAGRDTILNASTGAGKTMLINLPMLLRPASISITISPLKRLMASQAAELRRCGLRAAIVNEDTSHDPDLSNRSSMGTMTTSIYLPNSYNDTKVILPAFITSPINLLSASGSKLSISMKDTKQAAPL